MIYWNTALLKFAVLGVPSPLIKEVCWQMQIPQKTCRGRSNLLCFDIFPSLPTAGAWDHLKGSLASSCGMSTSLLPVQGSTDIMRSLSCNSSPCSLLLWAGTCCAGAGGNLLCNALNIGTTRSYSEHQCKLKIASMAGKSQVRLGGYQLLVWVGFSRLFIFASSTGTVQAIPPRRLG